MDYIKVAKISDFEKSTWKAIKVFAKNIGIFKRQDGTFYSMEISCKHQQANLLINGIPPSEKTIKCYRHGWEYDLETGKCLTSPDGYFDLRFYETKIEVEDIYISTTPKPK